MIQNDTYQKGITIYLAMLVMSSALATALFVSSVFVREFRIARDVADSARAVYVADSAMEYALYTRRATDDFSSFTLSGENVYTLDSITCGSFASIVATNAACSIDVARKIPLGSRPGCPDPAPCAAVDFDCTAITTKGSYGTTNRALEIIFPNC